jgi:hypothetical protein
VSDEWRLLIELDADGALEPVAKELVSELAAEIGLHRAGDGLVAYADTPEAAHSAERLLRRELEQRGLEHVAPAVERWSHDDQEWQDANGNPTEPEDDAEDDEPDAEEDNDLDDEPSDAVSWTVRISLAHHSEAKRLAEDLKAEGWVASSSWHKLEATTRSREEAETLAAELESRAPGSAPVFWANE